MYKKPARIRSHKGQVTIEFALMSSLAFMMVLGTIEFSRVFMIRSGVSNAAYQGARRGIVPGATPAVIESVARDALARSFVKVANIEITPSVINSSTNEVTVKVRVDLAKNSWTASRFTKGMFIERQCTLSRQIID